MTRLAPTFLILACIGVVLIAMPSEFANLPLGARMWAYALAVLFFAMGISVSPRRS